MEDILRAIGAEDVLHAALVGDARDDGHGLHLGELPLEHQSHVVLRRLCLIDQDEARRRELRNLVHHLGTDAAGGAGDEDVGTGEQRLDSLQIDLNLVAWQEVFNLHLLEL